MKKRNGIAVDYNVDHYKSGYFPPLMEDNYLLYSHGEKENDEYFS